MYTTKDKNVRALVSALKEFLERKHSSYIFYLSGQMDRLRIFNDPEGISIDMSPNSSEEEIKRWEEIK